MCLFPLAFATKFAFKLYNSSAAFNRNLRKRELFSNKSFPVTLTNERYLYG